MSAPEDNPADDVQPTREEWEAWEQSRQRTATDNTKPGEAMTEVWAVVELMGHVRVAGRVTEEEKFGGKLGRIDVPTADGGFVTQYFGASSVYRLTIVSEEAARLVAKSARPEPVHSWELPKQLAPSAPTPTEPDPPRDHDPYRF